MPTTICPDCKEDIYVDADSEQGDIVSCDECGIKLELVGLDPIELDVHVGAERFEDYGDDFEDFAYEDRY